MSIQRNKTVKRLFTLFLFLVLVVGCFSIAQAADKSIKLNNTKKTLYIYTNKLNPTFQLVATTTPEGAAVKWQSSDTAIGKVDKNGKVTCVAEGTCTVTCSLVDDPAVKATCKMVFAKKMATSVELQASTLTLYMSTDNATPTGTMKLVATPSNTFLPSVTWKTGNSSIATVTKSGKVTGMKLGSTGITATLSDGTVLTGKINVKRLPVETLALNQTAKTLTITADKPNPTYKLTTTITPANAIFPVHEWVSTNTSVATVDANGKVTAIAPGTTNVYCRLKDGSKLKATCKITVKNQPVTKIVLDVTAKTLTIKPSNMNPTCKLTATVTPANAVSKKVTWTSSNTSVATVSSTGKVTAKGAGTATITCTAADGSGKSATCKITVNKQAAKLRYTNAHVYYSYGYPKLDITFINDTYDIIDRIDFRAEYYDIYGKKIYGYGYYTHDDNWLSTTLYPGESSGNNWYWDAWGYDGAYSVKITLMKYHTTSGKTVYLK